MAQNGLPCPALAVAAFWLSLPVPGRYNIDSTRRKAQGN